MQKIVFEFFINSILLMLVVSPLFLLGAIVTKNFNTKAILLFFLIFNCENLLLKLGAYLQHNKISFLSRLEYNWTGKILTTGLILYLAFSFKGKKSLEETGLLFKFNNFKMNFVVLFIILYL